MRRVSGTAAILVLAFVAVLAPPRGQQALKSIRLVLGWLPQSQFAGYYVAKDEGLYRAQGLDVHILPGGPGKDPSTLLRDGGAEFATFLLPGALEELDKGLPLLHLAQVVNRSNQVIVGWKDRGITRVEDLQGKRVSLWQSVWGASYRALFKARGIGIEAVPQFSSVSLFLHKGVDACAAMSYNELNRIYLSGVERDQLTVLPLRDEGYGTALRGLQGRRGVAVMGRGTIAWRMTLWIGIGGSAVLGLLVWSTAVHSRKVLERELEAKARAIAGATAGRVEAV